VSRPLFMTKGRADIDSELGPASLADTIAFPRTPVVGRVRVMLFLGSLGGGGAERVAVNLLNRCDPRAVDIRVGLLRRDGPLLGEVDPSRVTALPEQRRSFTSAATLPVRVAAMIREVRPQVLMTFGLGVDAVTWPALRLLGNARPRWICRQDSNPDAELENLEIGPLTRSVVRGYMRAVHGSADDLVAVARDLAGRVDREMRKGDRPTRAIYNPIDVAGIKRLAAQPLALTLVRPFIVAAGRLVHQKGFDLLIKAFAESRAAAGMELVILGDGPLKAALERQAAALGVAERVRFPGYQDNPWSWFARARVLVVPSRWEGFGNVVAEALACGVPTLVSDCDYGPREQVVHGVSGWTVKSEDPKALTAALDALLTDDHLAARLGAAARRRARDFDADAIAQTYTDLFLEQVGQLAQPRARALVEA
jgi:glycosyltransferase involved in cell wall biosynthesis